MVKNKSEIQERRLSCTRSKHNAPGQRSCAIFMWPYRCLQRLDVTACSPWTPPRLDFHKPRIYSPHIPRIYPTMVRGSDVLLILVSSFLSRSTKLLSPPQVAILFPPAAVGFMTGCSCDLLINILLTSMSHSLLRFILNKDDVFQSLATSLGTPVNLSKLSPHTNASLIVTSTHSG